MANLPKCPGCGRFVNPNKTSTVPVNVWSAFELQETYYMHQKCALKEWVSYKFGLKTKIKVK